jgi:hypothetical protein
MDEEKMQRQMEFIVEQQAQFAVQHAQSAARIAQLEDLLVRFARATRDRFEVTDQRAQETSRIIEAADRRVEEVDRKVAALIDAQIRAEDRVAEVDRRAKESAADFDRRLALLLDSQRMTQEAVRNLAAVVERHIVEGHNGRTQAES